LLTVAGLLALATPIVFGLVNPTQIQAESQEQNTTGVAPAYEVASFKPNKYTTRMLGLGFVFGRFTAMGVTLQGLIQEAYEIEEDRISGAPRLLNSERYDVDAKTDSTIAGALQKLTFDQRVLQYRRMLQALLKDRLKLTFHWETKELPVFALVIAKNGSKLREAKPDDTYPNGMKDLEGHGHGDVMRFRKRLLAGQGVSIAFLVQMLSQQQLGRPVVDKTGLTGKYDFTLQWTPDESRAPMFKGSEGQQDGGGEPTSHSSELSIFSAVQEQLGLKLQSERGSVEVLVIDHVEKPSEN